MANLASTSITYSINQRRKIEGRNLYNCTLAFGNGVLLYPSGGVPIAKENLGCPNQIESLVIYDAGGTSYRWTYDTTNKKLIANHQVVSPLQQYANTTGVGNDAGVETVLFDYTMPANTLANAGDRIELTASGIYLNNGDTKTTKILWGATPAAIMSYAAADNNLTFNIRAILVRADTSTHSDFFVQFSKGASNAAGAIVSTQYNDQTNNFGVANSIQISGNGSTASDVVINTAQVTFLPGTANPTGIAIAAQTLKCEVIGW